MKLFLINGLLLTLSAQSFMCSSYQGAKSKASYNNREFSHSSNVLKKTKSENGSKGLTFAQEQVRKFIDQKDNYKSTKKTN